MTSNNSHLDRFVTAQNASGTYDRALREPRRRRKTSHWMWFIFPQIAGLGQRQMSRTYAIGSLEEARGAPREPALRAGLERYFEGVPEPETEPRR